MNCDKLKELANNATEGPWAFGTFHRLLVVPVRDGHPQKRKAIADMGEGALPWDSTANSAQEYNNAEYIAAVSPDVVLGLIAELAKKDADAKYWEKLYANELEEVKNERKWWIMEKTALQAEVERLRVAAQAVVKRWDTPLWKDVPATAEFIAALRKELERK